MLKRRFLNKIRETQNNRRGKKITPCLVRRMILQQGDRRPWRQRKEKEKLTRCVEQLEGGLRPFWSYRGSGIQSSLAKM